MLIKHQLEKPIIDNVLWYTILEAAATNLSLNHEAAFG